MYCVCAYILHCGDHFEHVSPNVSHRLVLCTYVVYVFLCMQFADHDFAGLSGVRVVRIATHPDFQGMGYGSRALQLLEDYYTGRVPCLSEVETIVKPVRELENVCYNQTIHTLYNTPRTRQAYPLRCKGLTTLGKEPARNIVVIKLGK